MKSRRAIGIGLGALGILFALALMGCSDKMKNDFLPNERPVVRLTSAPVDTSEVTFYSITLNWVGFDPDGRVDHFLYAVDPPSGLGEDTLWVRTSDNEKKLVFSASKPAWQDPNTRARDPHVFVIKAIDNRGLQSPSVFRAFFSYTIAPTVTILSPPPSALVTYILTPSVRFTWSGRDEDGVFTDKPVKYKYTLLGPASEFTPEQAVANLNRFRDFYAPAFVGWDSTSADTMEAVITNLTPDQNYLFAVVAFDEAGAYSPVFTLTNNILRFRVGFAGANGPRITMFNESFNFTYSAGAYSTDERLEVFIEVPAGQTITFNWTAVAALGANVKAYRWALDIVDVSDDTPRTDPDDLAHWSAASQLIQSATVGPFEGGEEHRFYIEAEDNVGLKSLGIIRFLVVRPSLEKDLGIVDDTRYGTDQMNSLTRCSHAPGGFWPTAAELDTFLYAKGGYPWRCYPFISGQPEPPSAPGLFSGYDFDTVTTRTGAADGTIRLLELGKYRHLIWLNDPSSGSNTTPGTHPVTPMTSLRYMTGPSRFNSIGSYVRLGGKLWLAGGGVANASTISWNDRNNDQGGLVFASDGSRPELVPGRFMYDLPHWQSTILVRQGAALPIRYTGRFGDSATVSRSATYGMLPPMIDKKTPASDPQSVYAPSRSANTFYQTLFAYEFLFKFLRVVENVSTDPDIIDEQSTLDTLYRLVGPGVPPPISNLHNVVMTYYHGPPPGNAEVLFSGFTLWLYNRSHLVSLLDFVLQNIWGLPKASLPPATRTAAAPAANAQTGHSHDVSHGASSRPPPEGVQRARVAKDANELRRRP